MAYVLRVALQQQACASIPTDRRAEGHHLDKPVLDESNLGGLGSSSFGQAADHAVGCERKLADPGAVMNRTRHIGLATADRVWGMPASVSIPNGDQTAEHETGLLVPPTKPAAKRPISQRPC